MGSKNQHGNAPTKTVTIEDCFHILSHGFLRGGVGGFLKGGTVVVTRGHKETRIGVALVSAFPSSIKGVFRILQRSFFFEFYNASISTHKEFFFK